MRKIRQQREKRLRNAEYALLYPARDRKRRKRDRHQRTIARERRWLELMGIERVKGVPLA